MLNTSKRVLQSTFMLTCMFAIQIGLQASSNNQFALQNGHISHDEFFNELHNCASKSEIVAQVQKQKTKNAQKVSNADSGNSVSQELSYQDFSASQLLLLLNGTEKAQAVKEMHDKLPKKYLITPLGQLPTNLQGNDNQPFAILSHFGPEADQSQFLEMYPAITKDLKNKINTQPVSYAPYLWGGATCLLLGRVLQHEGFNSFLTSALYHGGAGLFLSRIPGWFVKKFNEQNHTHNMNAITQVLKDKNRDQVFTDATLQEINPNLKPELNSRFFDVVAQLAVCSTIAALYAHNNGLPTLYDKWKGPFSLQERVAGIVEQNIDRTCHVTTDFVTNTKDATLTKIDAVNSALHTATVQRNILGVGTAGLSFGWLRTKLHANQLQKILGETNTASTKKDATIQEKQNLINQLTQEKSALEDEKNNLNTQLQNSVTKTESEKQMSEALAQARQKWNTEKQKLEEQLKTAQDRKTELEEQLKNTVAKEDYEKEKQQAQQNQNQLQQQLQQVQQTIESLKKQLEVHPASFAEITAGNVHGKLPVSNTNTVIPASTLASSTNSAFTPVNTTTTGKSSPKVGDIVDIIQPQQSTSTASNADNNNNQVNTREVQSIMSNTNNSNRSTPDVQKQQEQTITSTNSTPEPTE